MVSGRNRMKNDGVLVNVLANKNLNQSQFVLCVHEKIIMGNMLSIPITLKGGGLL